MFREYHAALISDVANQPDEARRRFETVYKSDRNTLRLVDAYGRFLATRGDRDKAKQVYTAFDQVVPRHPVVTSALADLAAASFRCRPSCATRSRARPKCSTGSAPSAAARATNSPP